MYVVSSRQRMLALHMWSLELHIGILYGPRDRVWRSIGYGLSHTRNSFRTHIRIKAELLVDGRETFHAKRSMS